jgi:hypothetical protein
VDDDRPPATYIHTYLQLAAGVGSALPGPPPQAPAPAARYCQRRAVFFPWDLTLSGGIAGSSARACVQRGERGEGAMRAIPESRG